MGAWNASINGNDTAQDLRAEYACAFYYYKDVSEAVQKIEEYVASYGINESDPEEYCCSGKARKACCRLSSPRHRDWRL